ncbi:MAG: SAM-dependent chlorinase/fluorinase [Verrucomicrobia bacterium]|nr:SAM-dependent chlorinase/fluorinase [Verrucomicrobiota bacterium]MBV8485842.1 SAM-dependent chlorinase/fluorinase [Verrucomicrobiota bacterium]
MIITLLTDFGLDDYYVAAMKGVILSRCSQARLIDISHGIEAQNVLSAAYVQLGAYQLFPAGTIHLAVVDPGVGSSRRGIILRTDRYDFVGPDNGLFSLVTPEPVEAFEIQRSAFLPRSISNTFHGRDIFAPVAAALAAGIKPEELGTPIRDPKRLAPLIETIGPRIKSRIIHIDRFGNGVTGIERRHLSSDLVAGSFAVRIGDAVVHQYKRFYTEAPVIADEPFVIWGSLDFLELSVTNGSAAALLGLYSGQELTLEPR